ncbi:TIGR03668 family PPOX class F420-dependent oxidoreductase [Marinactinospora rubrisoli]|uniref:TIGR03668 family PPOX class F420-dependent oxidoreductase n=1 Tax=Marinactinospora rubrisoli TaxID=2715399 RepID=A0ABW2KBC8_9ACTN
MRLSTDQARARFAASRVARLATADAAGRPHLVPLVFATGLDGDADTIVTAVDRKPKTTRALKRLANIAENPRVCLLADGYHEDWDRLWWSRADGEAEVVRSGPLRAAALRLLARRYRPYVDDPPDGPVIVVRVTRWSGWSARPPGADVQEGD